MSAKDQKSAVGCGSVNLDKRHGKVDTAGSVGHLIIDFVSSHLLPSGRLLEIHWRPLHVRRCICRETKRHRKSFRAISAAQSILPSKCTQARQSDEAGHVPEQKM